ncbi:hypothetical protein, partial [Telmatospirillum sp.]|uniref:hypothetical protein n=1 Tax=Telmatospirillum sp. TaxID=2079197 RepID=UPI00284D007A
AAERGGMAIPPRSSLRTDILTKFSRHETPGGGHPSAWASAASAARLHVQPTNGKFRHLNFTQRSLETT